MSARHAHSAGILGLEFLLLDLLEIREVSLLGGLVVLGRGGRAVAVFFRGAHCVLPTGDSTGISQGATMATRENLNGKRRGRRRNCRGAAKIGGAQNAKRKLHFITHTHRHKRARLAQTLARKSRAGARTLANICGREIL